MTWVVWRQHRAEGLILLVVLTVISVEQLPESGLKGKPMPRANAGVRQPI